MATHPAADTRLRALCVLLLACAALVFVPACGMKGPPTPALDRDAAIPSPEDESPDAPVDDAAPQEQPAASDEPADTGEEQEENTGGPAPEPAADDEEETTAP